MKDNGKTVAPWQGEFRAESDRRGAWSCFFRAIENNAPEVLRDLRDRVLPVFLTAMGRDQEALRAGPGAVSDKRRDKIVHATDPAVEEWARRFHIIGFGPQAGACSTSSSRSTDGRRARSVKNTIFSLAQSDWTWILRTVYMTMWSWMASNWKDTALEWHLHPEMTVLGSVVFLMFEEWEVLKEPRCVARKRILNHLEKQVDLYLAELEKDAIDRGLVKRPRKGAPNRFDWLVHYQIQGWSRRRIAREKSQSRSGIQDGINQAARLLVGNNWKSWLRPDECSNPPPSKH